MTTTKISFLAMSRILQSQMGQEITRLNKYIAAAHELLDDIWLPGSTTEKTAVHHAKVSTKLLDNRTRMVTVTEQFDGEWRGCQHNNNTEQDIHV